MNNFLVLCKCNTCFYGFLWPSKALCNVNYKTFFRRLFCKCVQDTLIFLNRISLSSLSITIQVDLFSLKYIWSDNTAHVALTAVVVINTFFVVSEMILYNVPSCQSTPFCIERCALIPILFYLDVNVFINFSYDMIFSYYTS